MIPLTPLLPFLAPDDPMASPNLISPELNPSASPASAAPESVLEAVGDDLTNSPSINEAPGIAPETPTSVFTPELPGGHSITRRELDQVITQTVNAASDASTQSDTQAPPRAELTGQWYALHVLSAQEGKVRDNIEKRAKTEQMGDLIQSVAIPEETVSEFKQGKKTEKKRKLFPGYVFVNMQLRDTDGHLVEKTWYFIKETPGLIGFADGDNPAPMRPSEVEAMLGQLRTPEERAVAKHAYAVGDRVKVTDGPFGSQEGVVETVNPDNGQLRVLITLFGRSTPVDLEAWQVEKVV